MVTVSWVMRLAELPGDDVVVCGQIDDTAVFAFVVVLGESGWGMVGVACKTVEAAHAEALHLFGGVLRRMGCCGGFGAGGGDGGGQLGHHAADHVGALGVGVRWGRGDGREIGKG